MKKLYTITMMLMLASNLFSQVSLPYSVGDEWHNGVCTTTGTNFNSIWVHEGTNTNGLGQTFPTGITSNCLRVDFESLSTSVSFIGTSVISIVPSTNLSIQVDFLWGSNTTNRNVSVFGFDGLGWISIEGNITSDFPFSYSGSSLDSIKVEFTSDINSTLGAYDVRLLYFSISSTVGIETSDISDNYNVYSYNKNLIVKSNDFREYTVTVYNLSGQVVFNKTTNGNNEFILDVSNGMYIVNVNDGTESFNKKVVVN